MIEKEIFSYNYNITIIFIQTDFLKSGIGNEHNGRV